MSCGKTIFGGYQAYGRSNGSNYNPSHIVTRLEYHKPIRSYTNIAKKEPYVKQFHLFEKTAKSYDSTPLPKDDDSGDGGIVEKIFKVDDYKPNYQKNMGNLYIAKDFIKSIEGLDNKYIKSKSVDETLTDISTKNPYENLNNTIAKWARKQTLVQNANEKRIENIIG